MTVEKIKEEYAEIWFNGRDYTRIVIDILDAHILFSYLTEDELSNPLWLLHSQDDIKHAILQVSAHRIYLNDTVSIRFEDKHETKLIRSEVKWQALNNITRMNNGNIKDLQAIVNLKKAQ